MSSRMSPAPKRPNNVVKSEPRGWEYIDFPVVPKDAPFKPNKQYYVEALAAGTIVGIHSIKEYPTFFKLFSRYVAKRKLPMKLYNRQVKEDLWLLIGRKKTDPKPGSMLEGDWREHGRYKWYAQQLELGETITVDSNDEATKVRRAWMLYVPGEKREERDAIIEFRGGKYRVSIVESAH